MSRRKTVGWAVFSPLVLALAVQLPHVAARVYVELGSAYLTLGKYNRAETVFLKALSFEDDSCASCGLGTAYHKLGRHAEAEKAFKRAIELNPDDLCAHEHSGKMYYDLSRYQEAIAAFKRAAELSPDFDTYMLLGNSYVYAREYQLGVDAYKEAIRLDPKVARAHLQLGIAYEYLKRREEAVKEFQQAIKLKQNDAKAHYSLAAQYLLLRNKDAARAEYEILRKIDPENIAETFEDFASWSEREKGKEKLYFVPVNKFSTRELKRLIAFYKQKTGIDAIATAPLPLPLAATDKRRQQVIAEEVVELMKRNYPQLVADPNAILIALTDEDMYIRQTNWAFAYSHWAAGRFAVVSSAHLDPVNLGFPADDELLDRRMRKIVLGMIGFLYYQLPSNHDPKSVLYQDMHGLKELDSMGEDF